jgi:hypothetical protein
MESRGGFSDSLSVIITWVTRSAQLLVYKNSFLTYWCYQNLVLNDFDCAISLEYM